MRVRGGMMPSLEDSNLIAAAPEMLEALELANVALADLPLMDPTVKKIRAAIRKAKGEGETYATTL